MGEVFLKLLNMSITASWLILAVLCVRLLFRKIPKWIYCILWGVVAIRLVFPFSIESDFSLQPSAEPIKSSTMAEGEVLPYIPSVDSDLSIVENSVNPILAESFAYQESESVAPFQVVSEIAGVVWLCGMIVLLVFATGSMVKLYFLVRESVRYKDNVYICDTVNSPFILGIIRPRIYLSSALSEEEMDYIIAHEKAHLRRRDHLWKPLGYLLLCVYWFNPLCWIAYIMLCRDIELACDEKVIKNMSLDDKKEYSRVLLSCAMRRSLVMVCPLAFGEVGVKERVKTVLHYKKPAFWITVAAVVVCVILAICFLTNPKEKEGNHSIREEVSKLDRTDTSKETELVVPEQPGEYGTIQDLAYYLELSASDTQFQDMSKERKAEILTEYKNLLDGYTLMARESADGKTAYMIGQYHGDSTKSPLYKMQSMDYSGSGMQDFVQVLYREEDYQALERTLDTGGISAVSSEGYVLADIHLYWTADSDYILIQPVNSKQELFTTFDLYHDASKGRAYIEDALARGIALNTVSEPYLSVSMISEKYGEITEKIPLSQKTADSMLSEEKLRLDRGYGFAASLNVNGESIYFSENGVPQSVLDLAEETCGYQFTTPDSITAPIKEARLDCTWIEEPLYLDAGYLSRLEEILKSAEYTGGGECGYGAKLTLTLENGESLTIFKGTDDCGSLVFGSYGGYSISDEADDEFWEMFELDPVTKKIQKT